MGKRRASIKINGEIIAHNNQKKIWSPMDFNKLIGSLACNLPIYSPTPISNAIKAQIAGTKNH